MYACEMLKPIVKTRLVRSLALPHLLAPPSPYAFRARARLSIYYPPALANPCAHHLAAGVAFRDQVRAESSEKKATQLLRAKDSTKRYGAQIAHDLGTPLQGLRLAFGEAIDAHNAGKSADSHHFKQNIGVAWTCINALMQLREMMMDESKLQLGQKLLPNQDTIDPVQTLMDVQTMMDGKARAGEVTLDFALPSSPPLPHIVTDPRWMAVMTTNLVSNAIKHARAHVRVVVSIGGDAELGGIPNTCRRRSIGGDSGTDAEATTTTSVTAHPTLRVSVHDDGPGIPQTIAGSLFMMYSHGQQRDGGAGIGLYSVKVQCETLGGRCGFGDSNLLDGAEVWFEIPFRPDTMMTMSAKGFDAGSGEVDRSRRSSGGSGGSGGSIDSVDSVGSVHSRGSGAKRGESSEGADSVGCIDITKLSYGDALKLRDALNASLEEQEQKEQQEASDGDDNGFKSASASQSTNTVAVAHGGASAPDCDEPLQRQRRSVLLVDDSPIILMMMGTILEREGYAVDKAMNGREGLERMQEREYDVVVSDLQMPVMDGFAMTSEVRAREARLQNGRRQPVLVMSANSTDADIKLALSTGADAFLAKPALPADLFRTIEGVIGAAVP